MHFGKPFSKSLCSYDVTKEHLHELGCFTTLHVKRAAHEECCDRALEGLKSDLADHVYQRTANVPASTENTNSGNWVALAMPDAIPFRLDLMTRIVSLLFLQEDTGEGLTATIAKNQTLNTGFTGGLEDALPACDSAVTTSQPTAVESLLAPLRYELLSIDRSKGLDVLEALRKHHHTSAAPADATQEHITLDTYLHIHTWTSPRAVWVSLLRYALGIHLHQEEIALISPAVASAMQSVFLTRDYWSWSTVSATGSRRQKSAVAVVMEEHGCSESSALEVIKASAIWCEKECMKRKKDALARLGEQQRTEVVMFLHAVECFAGGNSLSCATCPKFRGIA